MAVANEPVFAIPIFDLQIISYNVQKEKTAKKDKNNFLPHA